MDVLAIIRRLLGAIIILLCADSVRAISTPTVSALYSPSHLTQHAEAHKVLQAQTPSLLASLLSKSRRPITLSFVSDPEMAPMQWNPSRHRAEEKSQSVRCQRAQSAHGISFQPTLAD